MPLPESKKNVGLGRALINRRNKEAANRPHSSFHTTDLANPRSGGPGLESVTHQGDLEEFLSTAQLAEADFTAERRNVSVVQAPGSAKTGAGGGYGRRHNPFLLSGQEEREVLKRQAGNRKRLRVPRRPAWNASTTKDQLRRAEADAFLDWRRGLAELTEAQNFVLTPFERNLEVWRQLWRVVERSHLVVQIVDARNPLRFRCEDLEDYVDNMPVRLGGAASAKDDEQEDNDDEEEESDAEEGEKEQNGGKASSTKGKRKNLLLINKADLLDEGQRQEWARYFEEHGIEYAFFSAANAAALQAARAEAEALAARQAEYGESDEEEEDGEDEDAVDEKREAKAVDLGAREAKPLVGQEAAEHVLEANRKVIEQTLQKEREAGGSGPVDDSVNVAAETSAGAAALKEVANGTEANQKANDPTRVLNVLELEELFMARAPPLEDFETPEHGVPQKLVVGLVGYPNVGKSSTINALLGEKKVSVSSTPGHTKHFQTIALSPSVTLCDCPGLVFPQFATTSADLVVDGVLPIDQMREYTAPAELVARRIPKDVIEGTYGFRIEIEHPEEGGSGEPTGLELLTAYAIARGFARQGQGNPDESRAARYVLKDYVNAKLLFAHPPPGTDPDAFNTAQRARARAALAGRRFAPVAPAAAAGAAGGDAGVDIDSLDIDDEVGAAPVTLPAQGKKSSALDKAFFDTGASSRPAYKGRARPATEALRGRINPDGTPVTNNGESAPSTQAPPGSNAGKKHFKGNKRKKQRSGQGFA